MALDWNGWYVKMLMHHPMLFRSFWSFVKERVGHEERCEPRGSVWSYSQALEDRWDLCNPSFGILIESVEDAGLKSLEDHAISPLDLTISMRISD